MAWVTPKDMGDDRIQTSQDFLSPKGASHLKIFSPGNIAVVFRSGILRHSFPVASAIIPFTVNQDLKVLQQAQDVANRFARWLYTAISTDETVLERDEGEEWERLLKRSLRALERELADEPYREPSE